MAPAIYISHRTPHITPNQTLNNEHTPRIIFAQEAAYYHHTIYTATSCCALLKKCRRASKTLQEARCAQNSLCARSCGGNFTDLGRESSGGVRARVVFAFRLAAPSPFCPPKSPPVPQLEYIYYLSLQQHVVCCNQL